MPVNEDECNLRSSLNSHTSMSKAELRKTHKPIMEKRRRARINHCLNQIKSLILEAMNKDPTRHSKLEKADILEMAVKHLQNTQRQQLSVAMANDPSVIRKFKSGFSECATEIDRYVNQVEGVDNGLKERMRNYLQKYITGIDHVANLKFPSFSSVPLIPTSNLFAHNIGLSEPSSSSGDQNNNARVTMSQTVQLIPSRLPSGELALVLPSSSNLSFPSHMNQRKERPSAFAAVIPSSTTTKELRESSGSPPSPMKSFSSNVLSNCQIKEEYDVPQVSSTTSSFSSFREADERITEFSSEIKSVYHKKTADPLSIITNQSERYKQAQTREDSINFEENCSQDVKHRYVKVTQSQNLLSLGPQECDHPDSKIRKIEANAAKSSAEPSSDMWRPW